MVQAVVGTPASAAILEGDFCIFGRVIMSCKRGPLDLAFVEILLSLRATYDYTLDEIPQFPTEEAMKATPSRLKEDAALEEVKTLGPPGNSSQKGRGETQDDQDDEDFDCFLAMVGFYQQGARIMVDMQTLALPERAWTPTASSRRKRLLGAIDCGG